MSKSSKEACCKCNKIKAVKLVPIPSMAWDHLHAHMCKTCRNSYSQLVNNWLKEPAKHE